MAAAFSGAHTKTSSLCVGIHRGSGSTSSLSSCSSSFSESVRADSTRQQHMKRALTHRSCPRRLFLFRLLFLLRATPQLAWWNRPHSTALASRTQAASSTTATCAFAGAENLMLMEILTPSLASSSFVTTRHPCSSSRMLPDPPLHLPATKAPPISACTTPPAAISPRTCSHLLGKVLFALPPLPVEGSECSPAHLPHRAPLSAVFVSRQASAIDFASFLLCVMIVARGGLDVSSFDRSKNYFAHIFWYQFVGLIAFLISRFLNDVLVLSSVANTEAIVKDANIGAASVQVASTVTLPQPSPHEPLSTSRSSRVTPPTSRNESPTLAILARRPRVPSHRPPPPLPPP